MKLSIITINLNNVAGLCKTIESVVAQTFTDFEYIIIDGASTDGCVDIIKKYADKISYWVSEPDKGIYNAMNKGTLKASGEYLLFLNSGDALAASNTLASIAQHLNNIDIVSGYVIGFYGCEEVEKMPPAELKFRYLYHQNIPHQAQFIKRELMFSLGLYNEQLKILSDYEFNIKALCNNATYRCLDILISYVDTSGISYSISNNKVIHNEREQIFASNIPLGILEDYIFFFANEKEFHPALKWIKRHFLTFKMLRFIYNHFSRKNKPIC
jgi:glycosyltransferase involved in cell wall biosynthesis